MSDSEDAVRSAIEWHLRQHPDARDTVRGIASWWLAPIGVNAMDALIEAVLEEMVTEGAIVRTQLPDGASVYGNARTPKRAKGDR